MEILLQNTLTKQKETLVPLVPGEIKMYCCGPTVYGLLHVGNFRGAIYFNFVRNWLEQAGYKVTFVYNFTDVDDKIIDRAQKESVPPQELAEKYIAEFKVDYARLRLKPHDHNPKVTESMSAIIQMIQALIESNKAYVVNGEVLFSIKSFAAYGKLSHRDPEEMKAGIRIEINQKKHDPLDFALWKPSKPGEPSWESPWGPGRPGWHIECSAMIKHLLGEQIDIHLGGLDLVFPHHENEIAQSEGVTHKPLAKYWLHNNMINFSGAKMSKSLGNIKFARDFMDEYNPEIFKYMIMSVHYRSIMDLGESAIDNSIKALSRIYSSLACASSYAPNLNQDFKEPAFEKVLAQAWDKVRSSFSDDFNTPEGFAALFEVVRQFNAQVKRGIKPNAKIEAMSGLFIQFIHKFGGFMSLFQEEPNAFLQSLDDRVLAQMNLRRADVDTVIRQRAEARAQKDFKKSDEFRDQLIKMGIAVSDTSEGTFWETIK